MKTAGNQAPKMNFDLGACIRELRQEKRWTLEKLAETSGLSISAISKIENGQVSTSFDTLVKIAHGFGLTFAELFSVYDHRSITKSEQRQSISGRRAYTPSDEGVPFASEYYDYSVHSSELVHKGMIPLVMRIRTRELPPRSVWSTHDGEEFIYVTKGETVLHTAYYSPLRLGVGDSAYIDSIMPHAFVSTGEGDAELLSICMTERLQFDQVTIGMPPEEK
jgi:transcriptional regulator with XRE-family HTH domain